MIVYGDPQFSDTIGNALLALRRTLKETSPASVCGLRQLLIQTGQIEQAIADAVPGGHDFERITDLAAAAFYAALAAAHGGIPPATISAADALPDLEYQLRKLSFGENQLMTIKVPEGFEFYSLFPEQYVCSALAWAKSRQDFSIRVIVVGLRSIGTTLSAVVATTLKAAGYRVERVTVRPAGHPFQRVVKAVPISVNSGTHALVVDEGPGISGSSMVAVADALTAAGIARDHISFLPGHDRGPGAAASAAGRAWWEKTPRYFTPLRNTTWFEGGLETRLADSTAHVLPDERPFLVQEIGGGVWRKFAFRRASDWPAVCRAFERQKFLCRYRRGHPVHWKFTGLGSFVAWMRTAHDLAREQAERLDQWTPGVIAMIDGFAATPWISGRRCRAQDPRFLLNLTNYVADAAGPALTRGEQEQSVARLAEMLSFNTQQALGEGVAQRTRPLADTARASPVMHTYGDGRMAPHEWVETTSGKLHKTNSFGHPFDHTIVGKQSVLWDVAGTLVEWNMSRESRERVIRFIEDRRIPVVRGALLFYQAAYAAFRLGQTELCGRMEDDLEEKQRLNAAVSFYREKLRCALLDGTS